MILLKTMDKLSRLYIYVLFILFVVSVTVEKGDAVLWINSHHTTFTDIFFTLITNLGDGLIFLIIAVIMLFIRFEYAIMCVALSAGHGILVSIFKRLLFPGLERPKNYLSHESLYFVPGVDVHSVNSFPSGHTTTAFCAAFFIALVSRNNVVSIIMLVLAMLVGYSRMYLLQHFLIDVAAGAVLGCATTYMVWYGFMNANKPLWMNSHLSFKVVHKHARKEKAV